MSVLEETGSAHTSFEDFSLSCQSWILSQATLSSAVGVGKETETQEGETVSTQVSVCCESVLLVQHYCSPACRRHCKEWLLIHSRQTSEVCQDFIYCSRFKPNIIDIRLQYVLGWSCQVDKRIEEMTRGQRRDRRPRQGMRERDKQRKVGERRRGVGEATHQTQVLKTTRK